MFAEFTTADWIVILTTGSIFLIGACILGVGWRRLRNFFWPFHIHSRYRSWALRGAVVAATFIISASLLAAFLLLRGSEASRSSLVASGGVLAALIAAFFTVWTFLTTRIIRAQNEQQIADIPQLLNEVNDVLREKLKAGIDDHSSNVEHIFYMMDYAPAIGIRAAPNEHEQFKTYLGHVCASPNFRVATVYYTENEVARYHRQMKAPPEEIRIVENQIAIIDNAKSVWRTGDIGPLHVIIIDDVAFEYIVIPELYGSRSKAVGIRTEDAFLVSFLKETVESCIRKAITPEAEWEGELLVLQFFEQERIDKVLVYAREDELFRGKEEEESAIEKTWVDNRVSLTTAEVGNNRFLRVVLQKENKNQSLPSSVVEIPERNAEATAPLPIGDAGNNG